MIATIIDWKYLLSEGNEKEIVIVHCVVWVCVRVLSAGICDWSMVEEEEETADGSWTSIIAARIGMRREIATKMHQKERENAD